MRALVHYEGVVVRVGVAPCNKQGHLSPHCVTVVFKLQVITPGGGGTISNFVMHTLI